MVARANGSPRMLPRWTPLRPYDRECSIFLSDGERREPYGGIRNGVQVASGGGVIRLRQAGSANRRGAFGGTAQAVGRSLTSGVVSSGRQSSPRVGWCRTIRRSRSRKLRGDKKKERRSESNSRWCAEKDRARGVGRLWSAPSDRETGEKERRDKNLEDGEWQGWEEYWQYVCVRGRFEWWFLARAASAQGQRG